MGIDRVHLRRRYCSLLVFLLLIPVMTEVVVLAVYAQDYNGEGMRGSSLSPPAPQASGHERQTPQQKKPDSTGGPNQEGLRRSCSETSSCKQNQGGLSCTKVSSCRTEETRTTVEAGYLIGPPPPPFEYKKNQPFPLDPPPRSSSPP